MNAPKREKATKVPPGLHLLEFLDRSPLANEIAHHLGDLRQIADDHLFMWSEAKTDVEKIKVHKRYRVQILRAMASVGGFEILVHGLILGCGGQFVWASFLLVVGAVILMATRH